MRVEVLGADRVFTGRDGTVFAPGIVVIGDGEIEWIGSRSDLPERWAGPAVREFGDATILPGLIDAHVHLNLVGDGSGIAEAVDASEETLILRSIHSAAAHLDSGVTTVRECGAKGATGFVVADGVRRGVIRGPRVLACGRPLTVTGGHMWQMGEEADGVDGVITAVRKLIKEGAAWIKVPATGGSTIGREFRPLMTVEELTAIVRVAHDAGVQVGAHCIGSRGIERALDAGVDIVIHGYTHTDDGVWEDRPDLVERMATEVTAVNTTLHIRAAKVEAGATEGASSVGAHSGGDEGEYAARMNLAGKLLARGATLLPGSDSGAGWFRPGTFWKELRCLTRLGLEPLAAIELATSSAAEVIGLGASLGTLGEGYVADVVVADGDATADIERLAHIRAVFKDGEEVRRGLVT